MKKSNKIIKKCSKNTRWFNKILKNKRWESLKHSILETTLFGGFAVHFTVKSSVRNGLMNGFELRRAKKTETTTFVNKFQDDSNEFLALKSELTIWLDKERKIVRMKFGRIVFPFSRDFTIFIIWFRILIKFLYIYVLKKWLCYILWKYYLKGKCYSEEK